jgi:WS/DGAT/MGAT family acyltransferase
MRNSDAFSWYMERDRLLRSTVVALFVLDRMPEWDVFVARLDRATRLAPGFRHRLVAPPLRLAPPRWTVDPDFDLSWHVRRLEAPPPRTLGWVVDFARTTGMAGFDRDRPLWECTLVDGLEGGQAAVVMKTHHALTDGIGGMELAKFLFDFERVPDELGPMPDAPATEDLGTSALVFDALAFESTRALRFVTRRVTSAASDAAHALRHPRASAGELVATLASVGRTVEPVNRTLSPVMKERHFTWRYDVLEVPLDELRHAASASGTSLNDAFLAAVGAGLRRYHERHGTSVDELRVTMPISIRRPEHPIGGNRITLMRFKVPVGIVDPVKRMAAIHARASRARNERSLPLTDVIAGVLNLLPRSYLGGVLKHVDFLASDVPGIPVPLFLAGAKVERFYAFGPTIGAALNTTLVSYCGRCFVGVNTDTGAVTDGGLMMQCLREGFEEILRLAGGTAAVTLPARDGG